MRRLLLGICLAVLTYAQADSWLTFHGNYSGQRHTSLTEITPENVGKLQQVWRFETGQNQQIKASPIVAGGVLYITTPDNIWAVDARTAPGTLALPESSQQRVPHRPPWRGDLQGHRLFDYPGLSPDRAECQRREGQMGRRDCRFQQRLLVDQRSSRRAESRPGRRLWRFR